MKMVNMSMEEKRLSYLPEIWGGIECSINRVQNLYRDQLHYTEHYTRSGDIDQFADLGIKAIRYPVLWEHHQPIQNDEIDWGWITQQLNQLRKRNVEPIAGLLHHGSGPGYTDLLDENFAVQFASYASKVAAQFPWLNWYTPINEPLTTARFSGLYGIWYPHRSDEISFIKMLLNQVKATVLAMREIRKINPNAKLVQTEDLSKTHSTDLLSYQATFENERRWLTYDLLCGKVKPGHFFWDYFISSGIPEKDLVFLVENTCPPDIMGFNYYVTSERFLDDKVNHYPAASYGGNGRHVYADIAAVRSGHMQGIATLLTEAWQRYQLPIAITECHLCCTREEQVRWFKETWNACISLKKDGIDIRALTAWCLLGAYDWNSLLSQENFFYESGVFNMRENVPHPTLLAKMIAALSARGIYKHPLLAQRGWWTGKHVQPDAAETVNEQPVLIIGENKLLTSPLSETCNKRSIPNFSIATHSNPPGLLIPKYGPWAIIDTSCFDDIEPIGSVGHQDDHSFALASYCHRKGIAYLSFQMPDNYDRIERIISLNPAALLISIDSLEVLVQNHYLNISDTIMDLLIDEENGIWEISAERLLTKTNTVATAKY
jgi:dTDP-4-dehydrorhamnose reductase